MKKTTNKNLPNVHELDHHCCYVDGKYTGTSYYLYVKSYRNVCCVFTIETEIDDSGYDSIEIFATESFDEITKKWNEVCSLYA